MTTETATATHVHDDNRDDSLDSSSGQRNDFATLQNGRGTISFAEGGLSGSDGGDAEAKNEHGTPVNCSGNEENRDLEKGSPTRENKKADGDNDAAVDPRSVPPPTAPEPNIVTWDGPNDPYVFASSLEVYCGCFLTPILSCTVKTLRIGHLARSG
jgi:hypothetical protein